MNEPEQRDEITGAEAEGPHGQAIDDAVGGTRSDLVVLGIRIAALFVIGATLVTAVDLSINENIGWLNITRVALLPFAAGVLILAAAEVIDRLGD